MLFTTLSHIIYNARSHTYTLKGKKWIRLEHLKQHLLGHNVWVDQIFSHILISHFHLYKPLPHHMNSESLLVLVVGGDGL